MREREPALSAALACKAQGLLGSLAIFPEGPAGSALPVLPLA